MKMLFVGDPHATLDSIEECGRLVDLIISTARAREVDAICILGDLYHTHAVMRVEIMEFWRRSFDKINTIGSPYPFLYVLKGNHDMPNDGSDSTALSAHRDQEGVVIIDKPVTIGMFRYVPYMPTKEAFMAAAALPADAPYLVCHQSFLGFKYENGTAIEDGIDTSLLPYRNIISGHIHSPQSNGKVWYPGAPRWRTASDINTERAIYVVEFDELQMGTIHPYLTKEVCSEMVGLVDSPENPLPDDIANCHEWNELARVMIDIQGPQDWIEKRKNLYGWAYRVRTFRTDNKSIRVKESEGIENALQSYLEHYKPKKGTDKEVLLKLVKERVYGTG